MPIRLVVAVLYSTDTNCKLIHSHGINPKEGENKLTKRCIAIYICIRIQNVWTKMFIFYVIEDVSTSFVYKPLFIV